MEDVSKSISQVSQMQSAFSKAVCSELFQDEKLWERFDVQCSQNVILFLNVLTEDDKKKFMEWGGRLVSSPQQEVRDIPSPEIDSSGLKKEFIKQALNPQPAPLISVDMRNLRGRSKADILKVNQTLQAIKQGNVRAHSPPKIVPADVSLLTPPPPNLSGKAQVAYNRERARERRASMEPSTPVSDKAIPQLVSNREVYMPSPEHFNSKRDFIHAREALRRANPDKEVVATNEMHKLSLPAPPQPEVIMVAPQTYATRFSARGKKGMVLPTSPSVPMIVRPTAQPAVASQGMSMHRVVNPQRVR